MKQGGAQTNFTSRVDPNGQILMTGSRTGEGGAAASGVVAIINFRALEPVEATQVRLLTIAPIGVAGRSIAAPLPAPHTVRVLP